MSCYRHGMMHQLDLFTPTIIKEAHLVAESPRKAFYDLWLEALHGDYFIRKESGAAGKVLDRRLWAYMSAEAAEKAFDRIVREKTRVGRKSARVYLALEYKKNGVRSCLAFNEVLKL